MGLLGDADAFFRRRRRNPSHVGPMLVVGSIAGLEVVRNVLLDVTVASHMAAGRDQFLFGPLSFFMYVTVVARPFVTWGLFAVVFHVIAGILGGEGSFRRTLVLTGWGFLPRIPVELLAVVTTSVVVERVPEPGFFATYDYLVQLQSHPLLSVPTAIGLILTVWALPDLLWVYAVIHARNVERWKAIIAVNVPVGVSVLLTVNSLLSSL